MGFLFQPKGIFIFQYFTAFRLYLFLCQLPFFHSGKHSLHFFLNTPGDKQQIIAGFQRLQTDAFIARYPFHGKGIRKDKPLKAEVIHQQTGNYLTRKRRREPLLRLYGRHLQVPHHHSSQSGTNGFSERIKLYTVQTGTGKRQHGQRLMRIHIRIPMSRKVLADRKYTTILQPFGVGNNLVRHIERTFTEGTGIDNRILGIDIHIRYRSKIHLHPQFTALAGHFAPIFINQCIVLYAAQHHVSRKVRSTAKAHSQPPFTVKGNHQRNFCHPLRLIGQHHLVLHQSAGK